MNRYVVEISRKAKEFNFFLFDLSGFGISGKLFQE
jgi:hypothetical protein